MSQLNSTTTHRVSLSKYWLEDYWHEHGDPRVANLPLMSSAGPGAAILLTYAAFVLFIGPRLMANRKAYSLKPAMICYNLCMSLFNAHIMLQVMVLQNFGLDMFNTTFPSLTDTSGHAQAIVHMRYIYVLSKFVDLLDTVFFVLRKKNNQITALHFYHHFTVPILAWTYFRLCATEAVGLSFGLINAVVHTIMYAYYGLAAIGPHMQPYLWWKRYITQIQIAQFAALITFSTYFLVNQKGYPMYFSVNLLLQSILYIVLFTRFYLQTYNNKQKNVKQH